MLQELTIENFVLIEKERLNFKEGLNIITGETGAGKSIIFSAIRCLLGQKSTKELIRKNKDSARIEGVFFCEDPKLSELLEDNGFETEEGQLIISRDFNEKRSLIKINGRTCLNSFVKQVGQYLIDFHGQRDNSILLDARSHLDLLDRYGGSTLNDDLKEVADLYRSHQAIIQEIKELENGSQNVERELDLLSYQINEIDEAGLKEKEDLEVEERLSFLRNGEEIHTSLSEIQGMFQDAGGIRDLSDKLLQQFSQIKSYDSDLVPLSELAEDLSNAVEELQRGTRNYLDNFDRDEEELYHLEERNNVINSLKMKYGQSVETILNFYDDLVLQHEILSNANERLELLKQDIEKVTEDYRKVGKKLSRKRKDLAVRLSKEINDELLHLNLKGASLKFVFKEQDHISLEGIDNVEIHVITNPGEDYKAIKKIASGGEISRFMLAIKSVIENERTEKTLIYDEIDTGISGETAEVVGERLFHLAKNNQIISVTHLPQIAVFADHHLIIQKETESASATTSILHAEDSHKKRELGRLVAGKSISVNTLKHVEEMMGNAFKKKL